MLALASREFFKGWDRVDSYTDDQRGVHVVKLTLTEERLMAARGDASRIVSELYSRARLDELAMRIERNARAKGLRRYGRKRR